MATPVAVSSSSKNSLIVLSSVLPATTDTTTDATVVLSSDDERKDALDDFNHTRRRRLLILSALQQHQQKQGGVSVSFECINFDEANPQQASVLSLLMKTYAGVHSEGLITFLATAWDRWDQLGPQGQDPLACSSVAATSSTSPPLIPSHAPLFRIHATLPQRPSQHVIGQVGYYCSDHCTPIFDGLTRELANDAALLQRAVALCREAWQTGSSTAAAGTIYMVPTHPGHHAAYDSFGGYCYFNHVAALARMLQDDDGNNTTTTKKKKIAILDVDYHCGNGTAAIFYSDPSVLVVSLHCDPDWDYPFHSGFSNETGHGDAVGTTLHLPLPPQTTWEMQYKVALQTQALPAIRDFEPAAVIVSMGLDTYAQDPCAIRRAGFLLQGDDYKDMGRTIAQGIRSSSSSSIKNSSTPILFLQEGGYRMDVVGTAAANVVTSCAAEQSS